MVSFKRVRTAVDAVVTVADRVPQCIMVVDLVIVRRPLPRVITMDIMAVHGGAEDVISGLDSLAA